MVDGTLVQVESELEKATEHYRNQVLQFMGFFAAILAVALSSVQLATQLSFPQSGGLVLILVGGITISFEELKYLFSSPSEDEKARSWSTIGVGFLLITIGIGVGYGFLNSLL